MQKGQIFQRHGAWHLRYRDNGKQVSQRLAPFNDQFRTVKSVRVLAEEILQPLNEGRQPAGPQTLQNFIERSYLPYASEHKRPSTYKGYFNLYNAHIAPRVGGVKLMSFRTVDAQKLLDGIAGTTELSHRSLTHIKTLLSGVFAFAKRMGATDANPIVGTEIPKGAPDGTTYAYSLDEVKSMVATLKGTARVALIIAAWTGLSLAELRGLQWGDIEDGQITVRRTYWGKHEGPPKSHARNASIPLLPDVMDALEEHHRRNAGTTFVFEGPRQTPLDLATLGSKNIKAALEGSGVKWYGWHALRRGLATNLHEAGVQDKTIQSLLRHSSLAVTMAYYVKALPAANVEAMQKLNASRSREKRKPIPSGESL
jgi:integrase